MRLPTPTVPPSPRSGFQRATKYARAAETSQLLGSILKGHVPPEDFARTVAGAAPDLDWLTALGSALCDLGRLVESVNSSALQKQKMQTAAATRMAHQLEDALEQSSSENAHLRDRLDGADKEVKKLRDDVDFLSMFSPRPASNMGGDVSRTSRRANQEVVGVVRRNNHHQSHVDATAAAVAAAAASAASAASDPIARQERIARQDAMTKKHVEAHQAEVARLKLAHAEELSRVHTRLAEEKKAHAAAFETREEAASGRRKEEELRLKQAEIEVEALRMREAQSRAQAAAAAEVLAEAQAELRGMREENARMALDLDTARAAAAATPSTSFGHSMFTLAPSAAVESLISLGSRGGERTPIAPSTPRCSVDTLGMLPPTPSTSPGRTPQLLRSRE